MAEYIYFIVVGVGGPVKVGRSTNPWARCDALQTGHHERLFVWDWYRVENARAFERRLHRALAPFCIRGEWFDFHGIQPVMRAVAAVADTQVNHYALDLAAQDAAFLALERAA